MSSSSATLAAVIQGARGEQERRTSDRVAFYQSFTAETTIPGTPSASPPSESEDFSPVSVPESPVSASGKWHLVIQEDGALIFNRLGHFGTQEWLTGTALGGGEWDFRHSSEVVSTVQGVRLFDVADDRDNAPS